MEDHGKYHIDKLENCRDFFDYLDRVPRMPAVCDNEYSNSYTNQWCIYSKFTILRIFHGNRNETNHATRQAIIAYPDKFSIRASTYDLCHKKGLIGMTMYCDSKVSLYQMLLLYLMAGRKAYE